MISPKPSVRAVRHELARPRGLGQLFAFGVVGTSGYIVNLAVYTAALALGADYRVSALAAFLLAVANNYTWNRAWTFGARAGAMAPQAGRFLTVSVAGLAVSLGFLTLLVAFGLGKVPAQAASIVLATPISFLGNKVWSFR